VNEWWEKYRTLPENLALRVFLWAQRRQWPVPIFVRSIVRKLFERTVGEIFSTDGDGWLTPLLAGQPDVRQEQVPGDSIVGNSTDRASAEVVQPIPFVVHSYDGKRPRCVVATGMLDVGGLDRVAALLGRRLPSYGLETTIVCAANGTGGTGERLVDALRLEGVPVVRLSSQDGFRWLKARRPDVVSIHGAPDWMVAAAADAGIPIIETLHGAHSFFDPFDQQTWRKERLRSEQINGFVAVSEFIRRQYLRGNPSYPANRIITIPNGVDGRYILDRDRTRARSELGLRNEFLFVSLARCNLQKNTFGLVSAFSEVAAAHPDAHLLAAGHIDDAEYFQQIRRHRDRLSCADRIHLCGHCPDVSAVLAAADAFVLDSFFEGWPLAPMEALYAGLPVVISDVGGAREQVGEGGRRGFVVDNPLSDPEEMDWYRMSRARFRRQVNRTALVDAMSSIVTDRNHWQNIRGELRAESVKRFSAESCVQRHAEVLSQAATGERILPSATNASVAL
jgi:glycosyltransferase involved in cell wall biosynthesis